MLDVNECEAADDILLKLVVLFLRVVLRIHVRVLNHVERDVVLRIEMIVAVDLAVYMLSYLVKHLVARLVLVDGLQPLVDAWSATIVDVSLIATDTDVHALEIVSWSFLPVRQVTAELILTCLEIVARIILVTD